MAKTTSAELTAELIAVVAERDGLVAKLNKKARALRKRRDKALAQEAAAAKVERLSDDEKDALRAELGVN